jgi:TatD DNase family protein
MLIDTHCHLTDPALLAQHAQVLQRAAAAGVRRMVTVATSPGDWEAALPLVASAECLYLAAGLHPHKACEMAPGLIERLEAVLARPKVVAVGEIGLEYHYDLSSRPQQHEAFIAQLQLARRLGKPVVVHSREAMADTLAILDGEHMAGRPVVFHCFTGTPDEAHEILRRDWYISLAGVVTFKNAPLVQEVARQVPVDRLLLETDSPYLTPAPRRSVKPNEPAYLVDTVRFVAQVRGVSYEELAATYWQNANRFFGLSDGGQ